MQSTGVPDTLNQFRAIDMAYGIIDSSTTTLLTYDVGGLTCSLHGVRMRSLISIQRMANSENQTAIEILDSLRFTSPYIDIRERAEYFYRLYSDSGNIQFQPQERTR
jgi:hypothetical protein